MAAAATVRAPASQSENLKVIGSNPAECYAFFSMYHPLIQLVPREGAALRILFKMNA